MTSRAGYRAGHELDGKEFADQRSISMTTTIPPTNYRWTTKISADYQNNPPINSVLEETWKEQRLSWLSKYDLEISLEPEKGYRIWRWLDGETQFPQGHVCRDGKRRLVIWWERRPWEDPLPQVPGLWPSNG